FMPSHPFFDMLGLDDSCPEDQVAVCEEKAAHLTKKVQRIFDAMVRRQRAIAKRRHATASLEKQGESHSAGPASQSQAVARQKARQRLEREQRLVKKHEGAYQLLLARMDRTKQKLSQLQDQLRSYKMKRK